MYSWANHGWVTTVGTVLIGPWLLALATHGPATGRSTLIDIAGLRLRADSLPSAVLTVAAVLQILLLPPLGIIADRSRRPQRMLAGFCVGGSVIAILLAGPSGGDWLAAALLFVVGAVVFGASNIVYNSYLPRLAPAAEQDAVSSQGFAYGYFGGGVLLALNLVLLLVHARLGFSKATAVRICFVSAGLWWSSIGLPSIRRLPRRTVAVDTTGLGVWVQLTESLREVRARGQAGRFLLAYLLFSDAVSAVIALSSTFITHQLFGDSASRASTFLFELILLIQVVAVLGALAFGKLAGRIGAKPALLISLGIWCLIIGYAYLVLQNKAEAVVAGIAIGLVLGGSQALARSLWSQLVPVGREATYFGLFQIASEGTAWVAPLLFTVVVNLTGSFRQAILSLLILFVAGGAILAATDVTPA